VTSIALLAAWPQLVSLLWDPNPAIPPAAAPVVGSLGAAAAQLPPPPPGGAPLPAPPPTLIFDWLLPLLVGQLGPEGRRSTPGMQVTGGREQQALATGARMNACAQNICPAITCARLATLPPAPSPLPEAL
jgi:hypothetical protein